jgi:hypothetical protein
MAEFLKHKKLNWNGSKGELADRIMLYISFSLWLMIEINIFKKIVIIMDCLIFILIIVILIISKIHINNMTEPSSP